MLIMNVKVRDDRQLRALTGLGETAFNKLLIKFSETRQKHLYKMYAKGVIKGSRQRKPGGGSKGRLATDRDKLMFILHYHKSYPTFDVLGTEYNLSRSNANTNVHKLTPILHETLSEMGMVPHRRFKNPIELKAALAGVDLILIDATERAYRRSQNNAIQRLYYSGKQRQHTIKNMVIAGVDKFIYFLGQTFTGHNHDYTMLKTELPPELEWFTDIRVLVDLGYLGIQSDYHGERIEIPHKKPRKSKKNPKPTLTDQQKAENKALSQVRIFVENAISGIKRFNILVHDFRNHTKDFDDRVIAICAGLWNFSLAY